MEEVTQKNQSGKAVMNMSLGGMFAQSTNLAIEQLRLAGVVPVVAAGNENVSWAPSVPQAQPVRTCKDTNASPTARHGEHLPRLGKERHNRRRH